MMGRNDKPQKPLFYAFNLDDLVPQDHLLRKIDCFLDSSDLHEHLTPWYAAVFVKILQYRLVAQ